MLALVVMLEANSLELVVTRFIPAMCFCCLLCTVLGSGFTEFNQRNRWSRSHGFCVLGDLRPSHSHLGCGAGGGRVGEIPQDRVGQADWSLKVPAKIFFPKMDNHWMTRRGRLEDALWTTIMTVPKKQVILLFLSS
ncbi:unnamed protein product [Durusdinium trenchii]|uniref:Secreted protein n=1 Tax=Durusdinium trenchii TaxID=1381693 RepID=A0ABP0SCH9_9DINO